MRRIAEEGSWCQRKCHELARSRLKWAEHVDRMEGVRLTKRTDALIVECRRRSGRPRLRWEDGGSVRGKESEGERRR